MFMTHSCSSLFLPTENPEPAITVIEQAVLWVLEGLKPSWVAVEQLNLSDGLRSLQSCRNSRKQTQLYLNLNSISVIPND